MLFKKNWRKIVLFIFSLVFIFSLIFLIANYGVDAIINFIGIENSYLILFVFAIFGGVSFLTSSSFYATMIALYLAGLNLFALISIGALGLVIGDSFFYFVGRKGNNIFTSSINRKIKKTHDKISRISPNLMFFFIFLYSGFLALPKDILCLTLGIIKYPYFKFMAPMALGNLVFNFILLYLISIGFGIGII